MPERKNDGILSLNVKKVTNLAHRLEKQIEYYSMGVYFFIMRLILVRIWRDNLPKYGKPITKFFLGTVLTTGLGASIFI